MFETDVDPFCDCGNTPCTCAADWAEYEAKQVAEREELHRRLKEYSDRYEAMTPEEREAEDKRQWDAYCEANDTPEMYEAERRDMTWRQEYVV